MHQTNLNPVSSINSTKTFPSFSQPKIFGFFSVGPNREFIPSAKLLKYFNPPKPEADRHLRLDLNQGFEIRQAKPESAKQERIDHLLRFILENIDRLRERQPQENVKRQLGCDYVCFRGLLRMVMCTPYERKTSWIVQASKYRGTIYLCAKDTPEKTREEANQTDQQKRFCFYGFKFEQHVLTDEPHSKPNTSEPVLESEEFCALFSATLEGKRIWYGAEMDGIVPSAESVDRDHLDTDLLNRLEFVEVKAKRRETNQRQVDSFHRFKTRNWWCQSFLVNIQRIFVGLRDDRGIVSEIKEMSLKEIDRSSRKFWSASVCMTFCYQFLAKVGEIMEGVDCKDTVYQFEYDADRNRNIVFSVKEGRTENSFLPDWYCSVVK